MATKNVTRPEDLATQIGVSGKIVRGFLRRTFPRPANAKGSTWILTPAQVKATRAHFKALQSSDTPVTRKAKAQNASKRVTRKASGVTVTKRKATVKAGTRAKLTAGLPPTYDTPKGDTPDA